MNKRSLLITSIIFSLCLLVFACRKDLNNYVKNQKVASVNLESVRIYYDLLTNIKSDSPMLRPLWDDSWTVKSAGGTKLIIVPTVENHMEGDRLNVRRVFIFEMEGTNVKEGKIVEFVGLDYDVSTNLNKLIENHDKNNIPHFNGAILTYSIFYTFNHAFNYTEGSKTDKTSSIVKSSSDLVLKQLKAKKTMSTGNSNGRKTSVYNFNFQPNCTYWLIYDGWGALYNVITLGCEDPLYITGGYGSGSGGSYSSGSTPGNSTVMDPSLPYGGTGFALHFFATPSLDLAKLLKCFANVPDLGATYKITISVDVHNNEDPSSVFSVGNKAGHAYISLTKTSADGKSLTKTFGFYPGNSVQTIISITTGNVGSTIKEDGGNEVNASASSDLDASHFETAMATALSAKNNSYNLTNYNCTNFALAVYNGSSPVTPLSVSDSHVGGVAVGKTPAGLYQDIVRVKGLNRGGVTVFPQTQPGKAPVRTGVCN